MTQLWSRMRQFLLADQQRPLQDRVLTTARLGARYVREVGAGRIFLRDCDEVGAGARVIGGRPHIDNQGYMSVGARSVFICDMGPLSLRTGPNGRLSIGELSIMNFGSLISANLSVTIRDRVSIGQYCVIADTESADAAPDSPAQSVEIGEGVWIAARVTVLPGAKIGAGSVITAGSIVSSDIPAGVVAGGIPARVLRKLRLEEATQVASTNGISRSTAPVSERSPRSAAPVSERLRRNPISRRGRIVSDFTATEFERRLNDDSEPPFVAFESAPFGQVIPSLLAPVDDGDVLVVWTRPETVVPAFASLLAFEDIDEATVLLQVEEFAALLASAAKHYKTTFVAAWVMPTYQRGLGIIDARKGGLTRTLTAMNLRLMDCLEESPGVFVLNAQRWIETAGRNAHQPKLWYMGKIPFHRDVFVEAAYDVKSALNALSGGARKLLVLDLDDTLWGGIVGDSGWENLRLGGHDSVGEAFVDFQRAAKALMRRGVLLAIVSKNDESVALEAIRAHPEMVLRVEDFVAWRINWQDKARNVAELAAELNLGLQSVVFVDDNPVERARVREELPEVLVPEWPDDKLLYASTLRSLRCFDSPAISREDQERTQLYAAERKRENMRVEVGSLDQWLHKLNIQVQVARLGAATLTRTTQLMNKTNQLNLSTRRCSEGELRAWASAAQHELWTVSVSDRFGDAGLTGIVSLEYEPDRARIADFVLSCRVMGRQVEETLLHVAVRAAQRRGLSRVMARYLPTKKNKPCLEFLERSGFGRDGDDFFWDTSQPYDCPAVIHLVGDN